MNLVEITNGWDEFCNIIEKYLEADCFIFRVYCGITQPGYDLHYCAVDKYYYIK